MHKEGEYMFQIVNKKILNKFTSRMTLKAPNIANSAKAGQFVIIRVDEKGERIPLTITDFDKSKGTIDIIYQKVGITTLKLDKKNKNEYILDVVGPLGKPSNLMGYKNTIIVGGGTGCAIVYPQAKELKRNGSKVEIICGFRSKELIILEDEMRAISDNLYIVTDDGSNGNKGLVTDILNKLLGLPSKPDLVISVGPLPMMKAVCEVTKKFDIKTIVSMNPIMIDGTGMCGGCRVTVGNEVKFACIDGPDFDGHKVNFDEVILKNKNYPEKNCNLLKGVSND